jgi:parvulin-like peptidyl-prolyl isomerase
MPITINGQPLSEERILAEEERLAGTPQWKMAAGHPEYSQRLRAAAEQVAIDRALIELSAINDPRPIDARLIEDALHRLQGAENAGGDADGGEVRHAVERELRVLRATQEMVAGAPKPSAAEVDAFYLANREKFRTGELLHAAHIVKHVNDEQSEDQARAGIEAAMAELESGVPFAAVADCHSDCKGNGGDLGSFPPGHMVDEFDQAIRDLQPGQRTGIIRTPFGFHIAELRGRSAGAPAGLDDVRQDIERVMLVMNQHQSYLRAVAELRARADIRRLPVNTVGEETASA